MFINELFLDEISDDLRRSYLDRAGKVVDRRMDHMARVRDRLNKGYEIYHADRPAGSAQIVDRFDADTPALARQYYERFIQDYVSDVDFDLRLRRATGIMEAFDQPYPITWEEGDFGSYDALARLDDGTNLSINFNLESGGPEGMDDEWHVEFWRNNSLELTGEGDAQRVFATVLMAIREFIKKQHPERVRFSAAKDDNDNNQSRAKLYNRLVQRYAASWGYSVDVSDYAGSTVYELFNNLNEITAVPTVAKSKRQHLDVMPNDGRPIPVGQESEYLTDFVSKMPGGHELWSWTDRGIKTYYVYNPETRRCQLATTGRPYSENRDSFVVMGTYSGPKNTYRAADLYAFLILKLGITLVSDKKQSEGGQRVWQELQRRYSRSINIHGFDTKTNKPVNVKPTLADEPDTYVDRDTVHAAGPQGKKELATISRDLRFVASAR